MPSKNAKSRFSPCFAEIGKRIRWLRQQRGWSAARLAALAGINHQTNVTSWETASARIGVDDLLIIAHTLGVSVDRLVAKIPAESCREPVEVTARRKELARKSLEQRRKNGTLKRKKGNGESNGQ